MLLGTAQVSHRFQFILDNKKASAPKQGAKAEVSAIPPLFTSLIFQPGLIIPVTSVSRLCLNHVSRAAPRRVHLLFYRFAAATGSLGKRVQITTPLHSIYNFVDDKEVT